MALGDAFGERFTSMMDVNTTEAPGYTLRLSNVGELRAKGYDVELLKPEEKARSVVQTVSDADLEVELGGKLPDVPTVAARATEQVRPANTTVEQARNYLTVLAARMFASGKGKKHREARERFDACAAMAIRIGLLTQGEIVAIQLEQEQLS